jgi:ATP-dependent DNA helicase RecG
MQMVHPDYIVAPEEFARLPLVEPVYPLTADLPAKLLARSIAAALDLMPRLAEWHDESLMQRHAWPVFDAALRNVHRPKAASDLEPEAIPRQRLAYDELLANQLALALMRRHLKRASGRRIAGSGEKRAKLLAVLPYALTGSQRTAVEEVLRDMAAPERMLRLLQGDVGSGKTVVALFAMLAAVEAAPRPLSWCRPTYWRASIMPICAAGGGSRHRHRPSDRAREGAGARRDSRPSRGGKDRHPHRHPCAVPGGGRVRRPGTDRHRRAAPFRRPPAAGAAGQVGRQSGPAGDDRHAHPAHAGAHRLRRHGRVAADREAPGRQPIDTRVLPVERLPEVLAGLRRAIEAGARIYWVCPLVAESEAVDLAAAEARFRELARRFPAMSGWCTGGCAGAPRTR